MIYLSHNKKMKYVNPTSEKYLIFVDHLGYVDHITK